MLKAEHAWLFKGFTRLTSYNLLLPTC